MPKADLVFDFLVQFYVDDIRTPIEDTSIAWDVPLLKVAQVRIPSCDLNNPQTSALSEAVNQLSFSPWHATDDHRPLGNVMRARRVVYEASSALRGHSPEPTGLPLTGP
jgi:catalase